jgi:hypothetical protein
MPTADHAVDSSPLEPGPPAPPDGELDEPPWRRPPRRILRVLAVVVAFAVALGAATWYVVHRASAPILGTGCTAVANDVTVTLDAEQAGNAAIITAVAVQRNLPAHAATIALATALQESKLRNVRYGDRDSLGLFQQRPSTGWGTKAQILDPVHATNAFYDALVKIPGYRTMPVTKAAQKVQRSAFPSAYAGHEDEARVLASVLSGNSPAAFTCVLSPSTGQSQRADSQGLTPRAETLAAAAQHELGATVTASGASGTSLDLSLPAASSTTAGAWAIAQWAVARGQVLDVIAVGVGGQAWSRADHPNHWTPQDAGQTAPGHVIVQVS